MNSMKFSIIPFTPDHIPQAGELLAARHARDRSVHPELPARFEDPAIAATAVEATLSRPRASGLAAVADGRLLGYLIGEMVLDAVWGRSAWIRTAGCALSPDQDPELVRDLYAGLAAPWVDYGCFSHFALMPTADPALLNAWYSLSFGIEQVHALLDLEQYRDQAAGAPPGIEIRLGNQRDQGRLGNIPHVIWQHQIGPPVWGMSLPEAIPEIDEGWDELLEDDQAKIWLAFKDGKVIGSQGHWPADEADDGLMIPPDCVHMTIGATLPEARGLGIGTALTRQAMAQSLADGYRFCEADWRSANLLASRFWPKQGFRPVVYRLVRRIDSRIAWSRK
ncbi:MAG: GNAT family N-acetyltransferase [Anaerolineales bacterium]|nr:GNAT family N-acetyltransferase [Anaerolineales bacterium]